jgi:hypothetical protein
MNISLRIGHPVAGHSDKEQIKGIIIMARSRGGSRERVLFIGTQFSILYTSRRVAGRNIGSRKINIFI